MTIGVILGGLSIWRNDRQFDAERERIKEDFVRTKEELGLLKVDSPKIELFAENRRKIAGQLITARIAPYSEPVYDANRFITGYKLSDTLELITFAYIIANVGGSLANIEASKIYFDFDAISKKETSDSLNYKFEIYQENSNFRSIIPSTARIRQDVSIITRKASVKKGIYNFAIKFFYDNNVCLFQFQIKIN